MSEGYTTMWTEEERSKEDAEELAEEVALNYREQAHAPYSGFQVGAAIETTDGSVYGGGNVEWAGRSGVHAEMMAMCKAVLNGHTDFELVAVACEDEQGHVPCGKCLNSLSEFGQDVELVLLGEDDWWYSTTLDEELPNAYIGGSREGHPDS